MVDRVDKRYRDSFWVLRTRGDFSLFSTVTREMLNIDFPAESVEVHLAAAISWLCSAQDATPDGGVSAFYDTREGFWGPSYPETSGYIIPTLFNYADFAADLSYQSRAIKIADWLLTLQLEDGSFPIGPLWPEWERKPIVFDTGQIIQGLVRIYKETAKGDYLESAQRAGSWLVKIQDEDGCWRKFTSLGYVHTYNVRTAWAMLELDQVMPSESINEAGRLNLDWALTQISGAGWFQNAAFRLEEDPLTHTIAYTIEGLLESGLLLSEEKYIIAARNAADSLLERQEQDGFLKARYGPGWVSKDDWSCLTGTAQMAGIWFRLYEYSGDERYILAAQRANQFLKHKQKRVSQNPGVAGGIAGSFPIYGDYEPYRYLNWAAKFFVDSLLLEARISDLP